MTKRTLIRTVSEKTGFTLDNAEIAVSAVLQAMADAMLNFENISLRGIGTFTPVIRAPRTSYLPSSDKPIEIPERKAYRFRVSETIKNKLNFDEKDLY